MNIFNTLIFDPLFNALIGLYNLLGDMGLAIIAITLVIRILLLPLANKALRSQRRLQALQPELKKLQDKHKDDREVMAKELMAFYRREGVSPASSFLPLLIQIPILIALFFVFKDAVAGTHLDRLYDFVARPENLDTRLLGLIDLSQKDIIFLPAIAAGLQFMQSRMLLPSGPDVPALQKQLIFLFPVLTFVFATTLPAALPLYWATTTLFTIVQQYVIIKEMPLATAKAEAAQEWNKANPQDKVKTPAKRLKRSTKQSKNATVTVRKRGE